MEEGRKPSCQAMQDRKTVSISLGQDFFLDKLETLESESAIWCSHCMRMIIKKLCKYVIEHENTKISLN